MTVVTLLQEMYSKTERAARADLEHEREHLKQPGMDHAPHRTAIYRTRRRLIEGYTRQLNQRIRERIKMSRRLGANATGLRQSNCEVALAKSTRRPKPKRGKY